MLLVIPSLITLDEMVIDKHILFMNEKLNELLKNPVTLLRLIRGKPPMDVLFSLIYLLFQRKKFDLIENLLFSVVYFSEKYSLKLDFIHSLIYYLVDNNLISYIFDLQDQFVDNKNVGIPLVSALESMFSQNNLPIWYYLKIVFKSFLASIDEQNMNRGEFTTNLHVLLQRESFVE